MQNHSFRHINLSGNEISIFLLKKNYVFHNEKKKSRCVIIILFDFMTLVRNEINFIFLLQYCRRFITIKKLSTRVLCVSTIEKFM